MKRTFLSITTLCVLSALALAEKPAETTADPKAHAIIDKFVAASGGVDAFKKITTRVAEGTMSMPAQGFSMKIKLSQKSPDKVHMTQTLEGLMDGKQAYDGTSGWSEDSLLGFRKLEGAELEQLKRESNIQRELNLKEDYPGMKLLPDAEIDGKKCSVIEATSKDDRKETWYFDQATGLMTRMQQKMSLGPQGEIDVTMTMEDYQDIDGIKLPMKSTITNPAFTGTLSLTSVKHNLEIDDALFASPKK